MLLPTVSAILLAMATAQDTTIIYPTTAGPTANPLPSLNGYTYAGCWNETNSLTTNGGARALQGNSTFSNTLTPSACIRFCANLKPAQQHAGLEYGRECYCSNYLSPFSVELNSSMCDFACNGNASEICGGQGTISLYNKTGDVESEGVRMNAGGRWAEVFAGVVGLVMVGMVL